MKKQLNLLAIILLLASLPMYSNDDTDSNKTIDRSNGIASIVSQSSGVVNVGNSCFGRPAGAFEATVNDENGKPAIGASILIVGTKKGAYVKANGVGIVPNLSHGTYTIKISYAGYSPVLDTVNIEYGDTLKKSYELDEFVTSGCYFYCERIVDAYEIGSVTTFSSSEIQGRGWGANNSISKSYKRSKSKPINEPDILDTSIIANEFSTENITYNIRDDRGHKTKILIDGIDVSISNNNIINKVENNQFEHQDISGLIRVYPNPTEGPLTIELEEQLDNLIIVDMNGNVVLELSPNIGVNQFDLSDISSGVYFLKYNYKGNWGSSQIQLSR